MIVNRLSSVIYFLILLLLLLGLSSSCKSKKPIYRHPHVRAGMIIINTMSMEEGRPEFFTITVDGKRVDFFVIKLEGSVASYLDACPECYKYGKGFQVEDSYIRCRHCNEGYPLTSLRTGIGGCYPMPLEGKLDNGMYYISLEKIREVTKYF